MLSSTTVLLFTSFFLAAFLLVQFSSFIIPTTRQHDPETAAKSERSSRHYQQPMTTATAAIDGEGNEYNKNVIIIHDVASSSSAFHDQIRWLARSADNNEQPVIQPLNAFFEHFMAPDDSIEKPQWERALPTELERGQMRELILFLIRLDNFDSITTDDSFLARFAPALAPWLQLTFIRQNRYCVVHERLPSIGSSKYFSRLWGYLVLRSPAHCPRPDMHHSAPHFYSEGDVCNQSAAIFERTGSRSLVIAGASRFAVRGFLFRLQAFLPKYALADAAHNNQTMFHAMCTALLEAIRQNQTAIEEANTTFVQWHGMAETSCMETASFLSVGAKGDHSIYTDPNSTVNRLVSAVNRLARKKVASTPSRSSHCKLIATSNVFGRIVNGVPERKCCYLAAGPENVKGQFIHIEQKRVLRDNWTLWTSAIEEVFPVRQR